MPFFIHPVYSNDKSNVRDVALIRLKSPINPRSLGQNASLNSICLPKMSKVIDKQLNEYAMLLGWGLLVIYIGLNLGYTKINHGTIDTVESDTVGKLNNIVITKKLDNIQLCSIGFLNFCSHVVWIFFSESIRAIQVHQYGSTTWDELF